MAYVAPCGTIELYRNVPLTPSYEYTLYFANETEQRRYFSLCRARQYSQEMYTKVHSNKVRVMEKADRIANCNYLAFNNNYRVSESEVGKWYYAFIDKIEYINENVTEITYIIDDVQTWFMDVVWKDCYIERQHSETDVAGDNLQCEPLSVTNYVVTDEIVSWDASGSGVGYILVIGTFTLGKSSHQTIFRQNMYGGYASTVKYLYFQSASDLRDFLNKADVVEGGLYSVFETGDLWDCLGLYVVPVPATGPTHQQIDSFFNLTGESLTTLGGTVLSLAEYPKNVELAQSVSKPTKLGYGVGRNSYVPKNKKLLTYPYTYLSVDTPTKSQEYKYELFGANTINFKYCGSCNPEPYMIIYPNTYCDDYNNYKYSLEISGFPKLSTYQNGMMNGIGQMIGNSVKAAITLATSALLNAPTYAAGTTALATQNEPMGVITPVQRNDGGRTIIEGMKSAYGHASQIPSIYEGNKMTSVGGIESLTSVLVPKTDMPTPPIYTVTAFSIKIQQWGILKETAQKFDMFFHKYGYAQNKVGKPNIHARAKWTYIKTRGCNVSGVIPAEAMRTINTVMDSGITWWVTTASSASPTNQSFMRYTNDNGDLIDNLIL